MKNAVRSRRSRAAALCCLLLALAAAAWAAAAGRAEAPGADCVGFGNSFARLTSGYVEVSGPDGGYAAPLAGAGRDIARKGAPERDRERGQREQGDKGPSGDNRQQRQDQGQNHKGV